MVKERKSQSSLALILKAGFAAVLMFLLMGMTAAAATVPKAQAAFEGPFFYTGMTTTTYRYFSEDSAFGTCTSTMGKLTIDEEKTVTITEEQILTYYLHIPKNYDPDKSYPIISYCSGDGISIFCDSEIKGTVMDFSKLAEDSDYAILKDKYRQNVAYGTTYINAWGVSIDTSGYYLSSFYEYQGDKKQALKLPAYGIKGTAGNRDDQFVENWYELVYTQNREEYDCFFLYLQPLDRMWWEDMCNPKLVNMQNQTQSSEIVAKYGPAVIQSLASAGGDNISSTYVTRELSPIVDSQLLCRLIDELAEKYSIDLRRQYLAGYSLGAQFVYDTACHYPERFACVMTSGLPICDLTDENCKALIHTNFWIFNGTNDLCDANCYFNRQFIEKLNGFRTALGGNAQESYFTVATGGHLGSYMAGDSARASGDDKGKAYASFDQGGTDTYDFMFGSVRQDILQPLRLKANLTLRADIGYNVKLPASCIDNVTAIKVTVAGVSYELPVKQIVSLAALTPLTIAETFDLEIVYDGKTYVWHLSVIDFASMMMSAAISAEEKAAIASMVAYAKVILAEIGEIPAKVAGFDLTSAVSGTEVAAAGKTGDFAVSLAIGSKIGFRFRTDSNCVATFKVNGEEIATHDFSTDDNAVLDLDAALLNNVITVEIENTEVASVSLGNCGGNVADAIANYAAAVAAYVATLVK